MTSRTPARADSSTIAAAQRGDEAAFDRLFRIYQPPLLRYLRASAPLFAEDIAAQTWLNVAEALLHFTGDGDALRGWILTIGRRRLVDEFRRRERRPEHPVAEPVPEAVPAFEIDDLTWAEQLLRRLPRAQAEVVILRVLSDLSVAEVAEIMGLTPGTVRVTAHRALQRLGELIGEDHRLGPGTNDDAVTETDS